MLPFVHAGRSERVRCEVMIEITLLGTGSPMVDPNRAGPSTLVRAGSGLFLPTAAAAFCYAPPLSASGPPS
jgi:hypothetical protein